MASMASDGELRPPPRLCGGDRSPTGVPGPSSLDPPPDGGYGWVCVFAQFLINGFTWGIAATYSVYLAHYLSNDIFPEGRPLDYALIGGFNFAFALLVAPLATILTTRLHAGVQGPMFGGVALLSGGCVAGSFSSKVCHLYLTQGLCVGTGIGLLYIPATAVVPQWFDKKRSLANGICSAGSGIGGLILCFSTAAMIDAVGFRWSLRITAAIVFFVNTTATLLIRSRNAEIQPDLHMLNMNLLRSYQVKLLLGWSIAIMFGYITLMFSLTDYAASIGTSTRESANVAVYLNLGTALGRPLIGYASDRFGRVQVAGILTLGCGVLIFALWLPSTSYAALVVFAIISGAIFGVFWAVIAPLAADVVGLKRLPALLNLAWISVVLPSLFAEVIALQLRQPKLGLRSYIYAQVFAGASYVGASTILWELWRARRAEDASSGELESEPQPHGERTVQNTHRV